MAAQYLIQVDDVLKRLPTAAKSESKEEQETSSADAAEVPQPAQSVPLTKKLLGAVQRKWPAAASSNASTRGPGSDSGRSEDTRLSADADDAYCPTLKEAYCPEDVRILKEFADLIGLKKATKEFVRPMLRAMRLLRLCDYPAEDICCIMAHAVSYTKRVFEVCGADMDANEVGNVTVTLLFIAHSYTMDEVCPLKVWHQHLFKKYCTLKLLNAALFRLMKICEFQLRVSDDEVELSFKVLMLAGGKQPDPRKPETPAESFRV